MEQNRSTKSEHIKSNASFKGIEERQVLSVDDYERKLEILLNSLSEYDMEAMALEESSNPNFIILKRNFDMLLNIFEDAETQRKTSVDELRLFKQSLDEFRMECELRMDDEKLKVIELQKKLRLISSESQPENEIVFSYEKELTDITEENKNLKADNHRIVNECLLKLGGKLEPPSEKMVSNIKNELLRKIKKLEKECESKNSEISTLKSQQRAYLSSKNVLKSLNSKVATLTKFLFSIISGNWKEKITRSHCLRKIKN